VFGNEKTGTLKQNSLKGTIRNNRDNKLNDDINTSVELKNEYDDSHGKLDNDSSNRKKTRRKSFSNRSKNSSKQRKGVKYQKQGPNDFDPLTVKDGLEAIDLEMVDIDQNMPSIEYDRDDYETEELMKANKILREKVGQITDLVVSAIMKASNLKKQITTHRDKPNDPEQEKKLGVLNKYQKSIMTMKKKIKALKVRYQSISYKEKVTALQNQIKIEEEEIKKLQADTNMLDKTKEAAEKDLNAKIDHEHEKRIAQYKEAIQQEKEEIAKLENYK